jgi:hypothetical protein
MVGLPSRREIAGLSGATIFRCHAAHNLASSIDSLRYRMNSPPAGKVNECTLAAHLQRERSEERAYERFNAGGAACSRDPTSGWLSTEAEPVLDPGRTIIDPHHHFSHHWGGYGLGDLLGDTGAGHRVEATVYVQCGWRYRDTGPALSRPIGETEAVVGLAEDARRLNAPTRVAAGIVGFADLRIGHAIAVYGSQVHATPRFNTACWAGRRWGSTVNPRFAMAFGVWANSG